MLEQLNNYDWEEVFKYAHPRAILDEKISTDSFGREDISYVYAIDDGDNDGPDWIALMKLQDGRFAFIAAGCDYTGWG
jgi:hypothetical protein